jgi:predicted nucleic acid-binding protein
VTLCRYRYGHRVAAAIGDTLLSPQAVDLVRVDETDERAAWSFFLSRGDKTYSFTDCTSFVIMRRLNLKAVASLDDDFRQEGYETLPDDVK